MRQLALLLALSALSACNGDGDGDDGGTDTGTVEPPPSFEFKSSVAARSYEAEISEDTLAAQRVSNMLLASAAVVVADQKVQDRLNTDGGGGSPFRAAVLDCWARPEFPMFSFAIDYTNCSTYQMGGGVFVNDHPSGPLLLEFQNFRISEREIGGVLGLDTRDAYPAPLYWQAYDTNAENPGLDNRVQIGVTVDRSAYGVTYDGGASVDFLNQQWSMWGVATITGGETEMTVVHGAADAAGVSPAGPTGDDVLKSSLNWLECRCPQSGISSYDMPLNFQVVTIDIDDLEVEPDDIDDPDMEIPFDFDVQGRAVLTHTGCGEYDVDYQTDAAVIPLPIDRLVGAISFQCDTLAIPDRQRCQAMVQAASRLGSDLLIEVGVDAVTATAAASVERDFDTTWCRIY